MARKRSWIEAGIGMANRGYSTYKSLSRIAQKYRKRRGKNRPGKGNRTLQYLQGVTTQHDHQNVYRKSYMNKYKKKKWKSFVKKVRAVEIADRGLTTALYNNIFTYTADANTSQCIGEVHLYGFKSNIGSTCAGVNDLATIIDNDYRTTFSTNLMTASDEIIYSYAKVEGQITGHTIDKLFFESAVLDVTISNPNTTTIELDVYRIVYKKQLKGNFTSLKNLYDTATGTEYTNTVTKNDLTNKPQLTISSRGATPFEIGVASSMGNLKIVKKEKFLITAGQCVTMQIRDSTNRTFNPNDFFASQNSYRYQDWTQSMLFIAKKVAEDASPCTLQVGCTRIYKYNMEGQKNNYAYKMTT